MNITLLRTTASAALLAASALSAHAQGNVQLYGLLDLSVGRTQSPGGTATEGVDSGRMTTSHLGLKGSENLGGGLAARFVLEHFLRADTGAAGRFGADTFWARNAWVGVDGRFGSASLGRHTTSLFVQTLGFNGIGDSFGFSPAIRHYFSSGTTSGDSAWSDSVKFTSPKLGGVQLTLMAAAGEGNGGRNTAASVLYADGPLALAGVWQQVEKDAAVPDTTTWQLAARYDVPFARLFAQFGRVDNDTTGDVHDIGGLGASVPVGAGNALLQWGRIASEAGPDRTTVTLGYDHPLSPRTDAYAMVMRDRIDGTGSGNNLGVGLRHRF